MNKQIIVGYTGEGTTDKAFLGSIILRSFESVGFECQGNIEILPMQYISKKAGEFTSSIVDVATRGFETGVSVICLHCDSDDNTDCLVFSNKINPSFEIICNSDLENICKNLVPVVPVYMTEAWMLGDTDLLRDEIGTEKSDCELGIENFPESYSDPKEIIKTAIRISRQDLPRRRRQSLTINHLYQPIGQKISLTKLELLPSYLKFKEAIRGAYRRLNYLF